jgi:hypothetical protein
MFYNLLRASDPCQYGPREPSMAVFVQPFASMRGPAPGRCADCGSDAYIQLTVGDAMVCAHCYADRLGLSKLVGRKGGEGVIPKTTSVRPRPT